MSKITVFYAVILHSLLSPWKPCSR